MYGVVQLELNVLELMEPAGTLALNDMKENDCYEWKLTTVGP